ncbi:MAG TPA: TonB-dependent receptor, partial [Chitinophagaceae bacterium]
EAETGWNYELGIRNGFRVGKNRIFTEVAAYYFRLTNTLVQRRDNSGADYFINSGNTNQKGIEVSAYSTLFSNASGFIEHVYVNAAYSFSHFRYGSFTKDTVDLSGKTMPSVPEHTVSFAMQLKAKNGLYMQPSFYSASKIFLNDANTDKAKPYHLIGMRLGFEKVFSKIRANIYAGAENLLDEVYSLGNDINDPRGRYYNTAAPRNYYAGISLQFERQ